MTTTKIAVISDIHLGKRMYRTEDGNMNKFEKIGYDVFNKNIDVILAEKPDLLIYCGDIFETPNPTVTALFQFKRGLQRLKDIPSIMILGNHDFSFNNKNTDCSSIKLVLNDYDNIIKYAEYNADYIVYNNILFVLAPYIYGKQEDIDNIWISCTNIVKQHKNIPHKILITHGMTQQYAENNPDFKDSFIVPNELVCMFNQVLIGHIHTPFEDSIKNTTVISPGSTIDYQAYVKRTGPVFLEFDDKYNMKLRRELVDSPYIIKKTLYSSAELNDVLRNVGPYIYNLTYAGNDVDISNIDNDLFTAAKLRAVNIAISLEQTDDNTNEDDIEQLEPNFFTWLYNKHKDKVDMFVVAKQNLESSM